MESCTELDSNNDNFSLSTETSNLEEVTDAKCTRDDINEADNLKEAFNFDIPDPQYEKPKSLLKLQEVLSGLNEDLNKMNEKVALMCKERKKVKLSDAELTEKVLQQNATAQFFENSENRYRQRRDEHEAKLLKLREEQIKIQEAIFGK